ncbi:MAG: hypothetical protein HDS62_01875 [Bacteroidales bacterium]|nr:hypothetical protein [Bacteroidales bacterium]
MPGHNLNVEALSNIVAGRGADDMEDVPRACDTGACSSNIDKVEEKCSVAICRIGA